MWERMSISSKEGDTAVLAAENVIEYGGVMMDIGRNVY